MSTGGPVDVLSQAIVGRSYPPTAPYEVTEARLRAFVESTGASYDGGPAPATFPIVAAFAAMQGFLDAEALDLSRIVHGAQKLVHQRPVVVGDALTATLTVATLRQIGGNDILGTSSAIIDRDGALVCTGTATLVHRGRVMDLPARTFRITRADLAAYAEASGDHNPIHQDETVAVSVGLPGVIAHGMYTLALVARWLQEGGATTTSIEAKFTGMVVVPEDGAEVEVSGVVDDERVKLTVSSDGETVLRGQAGLTGP